MYLLHVEERKRGVEERVEETKRESQTLWGFSLSLQRFHRAELQAL
jgi:hypothetical protein